MEHGPWGPVTIHPVGSLEIAQTLGRFFSGDEKKGIVGNVVSTTYCGGVILKKEDDSTVKLWKTVGVIWKWAQHNSVHKKAKKCLDLIFRDGNDENSPRKHAGKNTSV